MGWKIYALIGVFLVLATGVTCKGSAAEDPWTNAGKLSRISGKAGRVSDVLVQFRSAGHMIGSKWNRIYMVGAGHVLMEEFVGANRIEPVVNGREKNKKIVLKNLWDGITVVYEKRRNSLAESIYTLAPNANPDRIRIKYNCRTQIEKEGSLRLNNREGNGYFRLTPPVAWQEIGGERIKIKVSYKKIGDNTVGFCLGEYNKQQTLIIDPAYEWHTFHGSSEWDTGFAIAADTNGNVFVTGRTFGQWGNPIHSYSGGSDIFVMKLNSSGELLWNTFFGSPEEDVGKGIAVDDSGNVYITGESRATWGSPLHRYTGGSDIVVFKLNSSGQLQWNTFYGSSYDDWGSGIAVDWTGSPYVTGVSKDSWGSPLHGHSGDAGMDDIAVLKLNNSGHLQWNTFYGCSSYDEVGGIAVDGNGNVYVAGRSYASWGFPIHDYTGGIDMVVLKLDADGQLLWNTFQGSPDSDYANSVTVSQGGNVYVTGNSHGTWGSPIHAYSAGSWDITVFKLTSSGDLEWNTFLGSSGIDHGKSIAIIDEIGLVYVAGTSYATWGSPTHAYSGSYDMILLGLTDSGDLQWNAFYGSSSGDQALGIAVNGEKNIYVTGDSSATWGSPINSFNGGSDIVTLKLRDNTRLPAWWGFGPTGWVNTQYVNCNVHVQDIYSGLIVTSAQYRISVEGGAIWSPWSDASCTGINGSAKVESVSATPNFEQDSGTENLIQFRITNGKGLIGRSPAYVVRVDSVAPTILITSPAAGATDDNNPLLYYTINDMTNVTSTVRVDGNVVTKSPGEGLGPLGEGSHTIQVEGVDEANNSSSDEVTITIRSQYVNTLVVDPPESGSQNYHSIQNAINVSNDNDEIIVKPGTYYENINFGGRKVLLISENGPASTIIDGGGSGSVLTFSSTEDGTSIIDGFTVQNGNSDVGGGVFISGTSPVIRNCWIMNNVARNGAGIYCIGDGASPIIKNNKIIHNHATGGSDGGGIYSNDSSPVILNNIISFNQADSTGGGVFVSGSGSPIITNNQMDGNSAQAGGGIYCGGGEMTVKNNIIVNSPGGDGIYAVQGCTCDIDYNDVWNNSPTDYILPPGSIVGPNDISSDPAFIDGEGRLADQSPCVDKGDNVSVNIIGTKQDKFGNPRIADGDGNGVAVVDMGIYEVENMCQGDRALGGDNDVDGTDLAEFASEYNQCTSGCAYDLDGSNMVNWKDLEIFTRDFGRNNCP